ncbi:MAG TPA: phosphatidylglycerophosphatase A, partial [Opitutales bacterium]|nr:phosphatidylglycerophosphatase A [Opitutales bacterium]
MNLDRASLPCMGRLPGWLVDGVATVSFIGRLGPAPGTLGAFAGTVFFAVALQDAPPLAGFLVLIVMLVLGTFFADESEKRMGKRDPGCIVVDVLGDEDR